MTLASPIRQALSKKPKLLSFGKSDVGCVRSRNEDAFAIHADAGLWAVADGMGGHGGGDIASDRVVAALKHTPDSATLAAAKSAVLTALREANAELLERGPREFGAVMGSTAAVLIARENAYCCIWVGDSRIYRLRAGELRLLTRDHRLVQDLVDAGALSEAQARLHPRANVITRAIGAHPVLAFDSVEGRLEQGDRFLLCSDGVSDVLNAADIAESLRRSPIEAAVQHLIQGTLVRGAPDNATALIAAVE